MIRSSNLVTDWYQRYYLYTIYSSYSVNLSWHFLEYQPRVRIRYHCCTFMCLLLLFH